MNRNNLKFNKQILNKKLKKDKFTIKNYSICFIKDPDTDKSRPDPQLWDFINSRSTSALLFHSIIFVSFCELLYSSLLISIDYTVPNFSNKLIFSLNYKIPPLSTQRKRVLCCMVSLFYQFMTSRLARPEQRKHDSSRQRQDPGSFHQPLSFHIQASGIKATTFLNLGKTMRQPPS